MITYNWNAATGNDVLDMWNLSCTHFENEIDQIFTPDQVAFSRNTTFAVVNQFYNPTSELVSVCRSDNKLLAYTWAKSNETSPWSDDKMIVIKMAHVDLTLSSRIRIQLVNDMLRIWENFARYAQVPIICSTTMRKDQTAFLKLHERNGYTVRGSYAYKRLV
jgi:hypothetical protein